MPRLVLDKENRKLLFAELKLAHSVKTFEELGKRLGVGISTIRKWQYGNLTIPKGIVPENIIKKLTVVETKDDNWGDRKGGVLGARALLKKYPKKVIMKWRQRGGRKSWKIAQKKLKNIKDSDPVKFGRMLREKKIAKRLAQMKEGVFKEKKIYFNLDGMEPSRNDIKRGIKFPNELSPELAEEMGMHLGDGTLSKNNLYYSIRGDIKEKEYYTSHVIPLYKRLYNLDLRPLERQGLCGIEINSKGLFEFKNRVLGIPYGKKAHRITVPDCIKQSQSREVFRSFIRGVYDTDGCYYMPKTKKYPRILLSIRSEVFLSEISEMLKQLGFLPYTDIKRCVVSVNGAVMLNKWAREIGTSNEKHRKRISKIMSALPWSNLDMTPAREAGNLGSNPSGGDIYIFRNASGQYDKDIF